MQDTGHGYFVMKAVCGAETVYGEDPVMRRAQMTYGPLLLKDPDQNLRAFVLREISRLDAAAAQVRKAGPDRAAERLRQLEEEKEAACRALTLLTI